jgi:hypothetical protein
MMGTDNPHAGVTPSDHHDLTKEEKTISPSERERSISTARRAVPALFALGLLLLFSLAGAVRAVADDITPPPTDPGVPPTATPFIWAPTGQVVQPLGTPIVPLQPTAPLPPADTPAPPTDYPSPPPPLPTWTPTLPSPTAIPSPSPTKGWLPPGPGCVTKPGKTVLKLDVPYLHQVNDIEGADGDWACGPTSVLMVLAYYGKVEPWHGADTRQAGVNAPVAASQAGEQEMKSDFAPYLTNSYTYAGHNFNATAPDPHGNRVAGLYGTIAPTGLADWGRIKQVLEWYGLQAQYVTPTWAGVVAALKRGHPVLLGNDLTPAGHILVAVGYTANNQLIVNDPYGNRFTLGYGANNGQGVYYPWNCARVHNALEVVGTRPLPTSTPTFAPTATATPMPAAINQAKAVQSAGGPGGVMAAPADSSKGSDVIGFAVQAISQAPTQRGRALSVPGNIRDRIPDRVPDYEASQSQIAIRGRQPNVQVLPPHRTAPTTAPAYLWLALPSLPALAGFAIMFIDRRRERKPGRQAICLSG